MQVKVYVDNNFKKTADVEEIVELRRGIYALQTFAEAIGYSMYEMADGNFVFVKTPMEAVRSVSI